jgi:hypothetical protein
LLAPVERGGDGGCLGEEAVKNGHSAGKGLMVVMAMARRFDTQHAHTHATQNKQRKKEKK